MSHHYEKKSRSSHLFAIIVMILGLACSIVGICIPISWMIGLGIGVICLGSIFYYFSLHHCWLIHN